MGGGSSSFSAAAVLFRRFKVSTDPTGCSTDLEQRLDYECDIVSKLLTMKNGAVELAGHHVAVSSLYTRAGAVESMCLALLQKSRESGLRCTIMEENNLLCSSLRFAAL
ncbi:hypothetical protein AGIG_G5077 [Arapaima gigas]